MILALAACGPAVADLWVLADVSPVGASTSATEGTTGCLEVLPDLTGTLTVEFLGEAPSAVAFTGTEVDRRHYEFRFDDDAEMGCALDGDALDCEYTTPAGLDPTSRLAFERGECEPASTVPPAAGPVEGAWAGRCTGAAGGLAIDHDVQMQLTESPGAVEGTFKFVRLSTCSYSADFTLAGSIAGTDLHLDVVDRATLPTYPCGAPATFEPVALDLVLDGDHLGGDLSTDDGTLSCALDRI